MLWPLMATVRKLLYTRQYTAVHWSSATLACRPGSLSVTSQQILSEFQILQLELQILKQTEFNIPIKVTASCRGGKGIDVDAWALKFIF